MTISLNYVSGDHGHCVMIGREVWNIPPLFLISLPLFTFVSIENSGIKRYFSSAIIDAFYSP